MATDIVGGLFGITPEMYQQKVGEDILQQGIQMGQLAPDAFGRANVYAGAAQLGRGIGGAMGAQDPQLRLISARNAVGQSIDPNDPATIQRGIQQLASIGDQEGAMRLADYLRKAQGDYALIQQRTAEKMTPEMKNAYAFAKSKFEVGSLDFNELYSNELARLTTKEGKENIKEVGVATGTRLGVYLDVNKDQQFVYQKDAEGKQIRVPYFGGIDRATSSLKVEAEKKQTEFEKILDKKDAERVDNAMTLTQNSITALNSLKRLNELDQSALVSGAFASNRVGFLNFLNTLGLTSNKDQNNLAKSENYQKTAGDVILATLGGKLGAGFSNEDRRFIESLVPQLENSPQARKQLIEFMVKKNQTVLNESTRLENYARDNKTLKGFVPTIPIVSLQSVTNANRLSEIDAEIARKQAQQGAK